MSWNFELVAGPFSFTEGPAWDGQAVLFSDIPNSRIMRYDPASGQTTVFHTGTNEGNGLMLDKDGRLFACEGGGRRIARYEPDGSTTVIVDKFAGQRLNSPNDLAFDRLGRLWFTDPRYGDKTDDLELDHQSVFRLEPDAQGGVPWAITRVTYDTTKPNGLLISPDQRWLYVAQSEYGVDRKRELRAYPIQADGTVGKYAVLHNFYPHRGIDGMCLDTDGNIIATAGWQESGPGPMIYVFAANGRILSTHPMPVDRPTNCTFGDVDLRTLYVTASGCLFRARTEHTGYLIFPQR
ncbi:MAG: SMP-30/gluconolactonase/LRE family protein [Chloroflexi bacterium]|nr:SMP-30/gluconolactonase/LRE family protein [Chloroflexota bacterium]